MAKTDGKLTEMVCLCNILKINDLFNTLKEPFGEQGVIGGGYVLTVALCQGKHVGKLALSLDFGAR
jgi:hypothetical protein